MSPEQVSSIFRAACDTERAAVEDRLDRLVDSIAAEHAGIHEAIRYCLLGGGKRLRPILCLWSHDLVGGDRRDAALEVACAIECIHTYSLIHDDLPCMDDDDYRRGQPSAHKKFGEATAVLTGDALLTVAFQIVATAPGRCPGLGPHEALDITGLLAGAAGTGGLITGQALDLAGSAGTGDLEAVRNIHRNKTARLIAAAMESGVVCGAGSSQQRRLVKAAGLEAGEAFQIADDVLDCVTDRETLGKTPGKDAAADKLTYPAVRGLDGARKAARRLVADAKRKLAGCGTGQGGREAAMRLEQMFDFLVERSS
jgi:geranylgeranyl pyrophosphate synthase